MALTTIEHAEMDYWYSVVRKYMESQEDWRYPEEATKGLLLGTANKHYMNDEIEYPVLRWRQLNGQLPETDKVK